MISLVQKVAPAVIGAVLVSLSATGATRGLWENVAFQRATRPPCPTPDLNPFGLEGSGLGKTVAAAMTEAADQGEHFGVVEAPQRAWQTAAAEYIRGIESHLVTMQHTHGTNAGGVPQGESDLVQQAREAYSKEQVFSRIKTAWLLDPTNRAALLSYTDWIGRSPSEMVTIHDAGRVLTIPLSSARIVTLCQYSLARYDTESGAMPEHCVFAATALIAIWNAENGLSDFRSETKEHRAARFATLRTTVTALTELLHKATMQQLGQATAGTWNLRSKASRFQFDQGFRDVKGFMQAARSTLASQT